MKERLQPSSRGLVRCCARDCLVDSLRTTVAKLRTLENSVSKFIVNEKRKESAHGDGHDQQDVEDRKR